MQNQTVTGRVNATANVEQQEILRVNNKGALATSATDGATVTKSDATIYDPPFRGLYVGTAGDVTIVTPIGTSLLFKNLPNASYLDVECRKVMSTGTTASDMVGLY